MKGHPPKVPTPTLIAEYEAGATLRQIARRYGVSFQTLAVQLKHAGVARRPKHPRKYADRVCVTCGGTYHPWNGQQRYCSPACVVRKKRSASQ